MLSLYEKQLFKHYHNCICLENTEQKSSVHSMIEQFGLEETFKGHLIQPPCNEQGHFQKDQIAQSPLQPDLEYFLSWSPDVRLMIIEIEIYFQIFHLPQLK